MSINIPDGVTSIGIEAFSSTAYYRNENNWENNALYIGKYLIGVNKDEIDGQYEIKQGTKLIAGGTFSGIKTFIDVILPDGLEYIGEEAFSESRLTNIVFPDSLKVIGVGAFYRTYLTGEITIPASVEEIGKGAFGIGMGSIMAFPTLLESINVAAGNKYFSSEDGVLFNKDKTVLVCYPSGKTGSEYEIPSGVAHIGEYAFYNNLSLECVWIPSSVTSIGVCAFYLAHNVDDLYFEVGEYELNLTIGDRNGPVMGSAWHYDAPHIPPITVDVESEFTDTEAVFNLTVTNGSVSAVEKVKLYLAEYDSEGRVVNVYIGENGEAESGEMTITAPLPSADAYEYKYMLWDKSNALLMDAITDTTEV